MIEMEHTLPSDGNDSGKWHIAMSMYKKKTLVHHWRFEDGTEIPNPGSPFPADPLPRGWYCWVYPEIKSDFEEWMEQNCPTADLTWRFNSGDPMFTVYIKDDKEAMTFMIRWDINVDAWDR